MQVNKHGIPVHQVAPSKKREKPKFKLEQTQIVKVTDKGETKIIIPAFAPVQAIMTAYGWEQREVVV